MSARRMPGSLKNFRSAARPTRLLPAIARLDPLPQIATFCNMPTMNMRVDRKKALAAKKILAAMGLTPRTAVDVFLAKIVSEKAIPFPVAMSDSEYARSEYGLTSAQMAAVGQRMVQATAKAKREGTLREVTGPG